MKDMSEGDNEVVLVGQATLEAELVAPGPAYCALFALVSITVIFMHWHPLVTMGVAIALLITGFAIDEKRVRSFENMVYELNTGISKRIQDQLGLKVPERFYVQAPDDRRRLRSSPVIAHRDDGSRLYLVLQSDKEKNTVWVLTSPSKHGMSTTSS